jgi:hypothetical protein
LLLILTEGIMSGKPASEHCQQEGQPMHSITMFDSTRESLQDLLTSIRSGRTQLPDFQRGWEKVT